MADANCARCTHYDDCSTPCIWVELEINGKTSQRERIADPGRLQVLPQGDYNGLIYELMRDREARDIERLEAIREIECKSPCSLKKKAILSMMLARMTQKQIGTIIHTERSWISRIVRK